MKCDHSHIHFGNENVEHDISVLITEDMCGGYLNIYIFKS